MGNGKQEIHLLVLGHGGCRGRQTIGPKRFEGRRKRAGRGDRTATSRAFLKRDFIYVGFLLARSLSINGVLLIQ